MATILKERPALIRIPCSQALAARVKRLEDIAVKRGIDLDLSPVSASIEKLVSQAERELLPPPAPVRAVAASSSTAGDAAVVAVDASSSF